MTKQEKVKNKYITSATKYLNQIRNVESDIGSKELELEALRYKASGAGAIRYDKDHVQTSAQNYMELAIADIIELSAEVEEQRASIEDMKGRAYEIVRKMKDAEQRTIIEWYYLNCVSMQEVCNKMNRSERSAYYLREDALNEFGICLNE